MTPQGASRRRWQWGVVGVALLSLVLPTLSPARAGTALEPVSAPTYPDLVPDVRSLRLDRPLLGFDPATFTNVYGPLSLHFDTWAQNLGTVPLDLLVDDPSDLARTSVSQCVSWATDVVCLARTSVGGMVWHEEHRHFHFEDFARYELRRVRPGNRIDWTRRGLLAASDKVSFCLMDTVPARDDAFPVQRYESCTPAQQGISPGWADVYYSGLPGQRLPVEGLDDGRYALIVTLNPAAGLFESMLGNNRVEVIVDLSEGLTAVTVVERRGG